MSKASSHENQGIYIHIPYCLNKCDYCAFTSVPMKSVPSAYLDALISEIKWTSETFGFTEVYVDTLYFGGGTPSLLKGEDLARVMDQISFSFTLKSDGEFTLELNPATADKEKLAAYNRAGINRLSIGVQSFQQENLNFLGRIHNSGDAEKSVFDAKEIGFENINLDLIFGLPGQCDDDLLSDLEKATNLKPQHISLYLLSVEENTPLSKKEALRQFTPLPDIKKEKQFLLATDYLAEKGYIRYETSNYAIKSYESKHNLKYWEGDNYLGLGTAAHSYLKDVGWGARWWNIRDTGKYIETLKTGNMPIDNLEILSMGNSLAETIFTSLRTKSGLNIDSISTKFGMNFSQDKIVKLLGSLPDNFYIWDGDQLTLTDRGALLADEIAGKIISNID